LPQPDAGPRQLRMSGDYAEHVAFVRRGVPAQRLARSAVECRSDRGEVIGPGVSSVTAKAESSMQGVSSLLEQIGAGGF